MAKIHPASDYQEDQVMKFLWFDAYNNHQPKIRTKNHFMGSVTANENLSKKCNILITGAHNSGKTRYLHKLYDNAENVWRSQIKPYQWSRDASLKGKPMLQRGDDGSSWVFPEPIFLCSIDPLSKWTDNDGLLAWWDANNPDNPYKKLPAWKKADLLPLYLKETRAVLFVDDAHKLTGRKLQIAKQCMDSAFRAVVTATDENRLSPSIRRGFLETKPQIVRLNSEVAYDATHLVVWMFVFILMMAGMTEMAAILGFFETMKGGRRASKQD